jgi:Flp pilus assembly protein TadB
MEIMLMNVSILLTTLGFVFAHRILSSSLQNIGLSNLRSRIFLILALLMIFFFVIWSLQPMFLWFFFGIIFILLRFLPHFFSRYQEKLIQSQMLRLLDQLILGVQSGQSLRSSLVTMTRQESSLLRVSLENLVHAIVFENSSAGLKSESLKNLFEELSRIEKSQSKSADQLKSLRKNLKVLEDFRRRSGQVTLQIRMQSAISALLYAGLLFFMITQFGFYQHRGLIVASATLFFGGMVTVFVIGRKFQWIT